MATRMVQCVKLARELPGIDPETPQGAAILDMIEATGSPELRKRIYENVSMEAWKLWEGQMTMVINEYRLDMTSSDADAILSSQMEEFFFGEGAALPPGYVPPQSKS
ncbi:MAG: oxidative damage protection protein [Candidatus Methylomirabilales bacterium]